MDLSSLSLACKTTLFKTLKLPTLIRASRINREFSTFVEEQKFRVVLKVATSPEYDLTFSVAPVTLENNQNPLDALYGILTERFQILTDPVKQVLGVHFDYIFVLCECRLIRDSYIIRRMRAFHDLPRILETLRPSCDTLAVMSNIGGLIHSSKVLKSFSFENILFNASSRLDEILKWPVHHCETAHFYAVSDMRSRYSAIIKSFRHGKFNFGKKWHMDRNIKAEYLDASFREFLTDITNDRANRGRLESFQFSFSGYPETALQKIDDFPGVEEVWNGTYSKKRTVAVSISTLAIDGGLAYVIHDGEYKVHFYDYDSNDHLQNLIEKYGLVEGPVEPETNNE